MKYFLKHLLCLLIIVLSAQASFGFSLGCASPSGESLFWQMGAEKVSLSYSNSRGPEFTPIEDGPVRSASVAFYKMAFEDLKEILGQFSLVWSKQNCKQNANWWLSSCGREGSFVSKPNSNQNIQISGLSIGKISESGSSGDQTLFRFRVSFEKDGNTYFVPLFFPEQFCKVTNEETKL